MRYLFIILAIVFVSCTEETIENNTEIYSSDWRWNMQDNQTRSCGGFEVSPLLVDVIVIQITSDNGEVYAFNDYRITEDQIILNSSDKFRTDDFNDPIRIRMNIKLICHE